MKRISILVTLFCMSLAINAQKYNKGDVYIYWGWNNAQYTDSDIRFKGDGYDFKLNNVSAHDRQTPIGIKYINPSKITIPQYNFRIGYFFHDNWNISLGMDHMKYVMDQNQTVKIKGDISGSNGFDGSYNGEDIKLTDDFLTFEHTDGLNYANIELRRFDNIYHLPLSKSGRGIDFNITEGFGGGVVYPKTNTKLMNKERYDDFHLAGFGLGAMVGFNMTFYNRFFIQTEIKGGYINMNDIRTTESKSDKAKQDFFYMQQNVVFGVIFHLDRQNFKKNL